MNINTLTDSKEVITIEDYLKLHNIKDIDSYLKPNGSYIESPLLYDNIKDAVNTFKYHILQKDTIYIIQDCDVDGLTSSYIMYKYIKLLDKSIKVKVLLHKDKTRGLDDNDILDRVLLEKPSLLIIPDANSNCVENTRKAFDNGTDIIVLDHHEITTPIDCGVLVNNQLGNVDKCGSGCVVTHKFLKALDIEFNKDYSKRFVDMCALSIISDSMNVCSMQNREYLYWGLFKDNPFIYNNFLAFCIERWIGKEDYTQKDIAFSIIPKFNAVIRKADIEEMQSLFLAFMDMADYDEVCTMCEKAHNHQTYVVNKFTNKFREEVSENELKLNIIIDEELPRNYSGLIASKLANINNKPTIVGKDKDGYIIGSCRSNVDIRDELDNNEYIDFASGHSQACGCGLYTNNLDDFINSLDSLELVSEPYISVLQSYPIKSLPKELFGLYEPYSKLWGKSLPNPTFHIKDIHITNKDINVIGKNKNTIKFNCNGIDFIIFNVSDIDKESFMCYNKATIKLDIQVVGSLNVNVWNNRKTLQVVVDKFELKEYNKDISLEDLL